MKHYDLRDGPCSCRWKLPGSLAMFLLTISAGGCAYNAVVNAAPSYNVVTSFSSKISGKWLLAVEAEPLNQQVKPSGLACTAHTFPLELSSAFGVSVSETVKNVFEQIEVVPHPVPGDQVKKLCAKGIIVVRGEEVRPRLDVQPGFWQNNMKTQVMVVSSTYVDGPNGRLFGTTVEGQGIADAEGGILCEGGAKSLSMAGETAVRDTVRKIGEALGNSERVRALGEPTRKVGGDKTSRQDHQSVDTVSSR